MNALKSITHKTIEYQKSQGSDDLIKSFCRYYKNIGHPIEENQIIVTQGGSEAIIFALSAASDPGDEFIVFEPFYTNYNGFATIAGVKLVPLQTKAETGFHLPSEAEIEAIITEKTRGIIYCNPNNPTGTVLRQDEVEMLARISKKHSLFLMADEVYREFVYDGEKQVSLLSIPELEDHAIVIDSVSKRYSLCGARIGAVITRNPELYSLMVKFAQARLAAPTVEQIACVGLSDLGDDYFAAINSEYEKRRNIVFDALQKIPGIICEKPRGAFYIVATLPIDDGEELTKFFLNEYRQEGKTVMIAPAAGFYATPGMGKNQIRIAYILKEEKLAIAMDILSKGLEVYRQRLG
jgi:aspartate aminotransferase